MANIDETLQGVHPFTLDWWRTLPECYQRADRAQGYRIAPAWHGLNRDPRLVTGWDKWHRTNTSTEPWRVSVAFTRTFRSAPHVPLTVKSWHTPRALSEIPRTTAEIGDAIVGLMLLGKTATTVGVRHVVRNHTGNIVVDHSGEFTDPTQQALSTVVTPDRFGVVQVTVEVTLDVPDGRNLLDGIHVGRQDAEFAELPALDHFLTASAYPLLRYLDGIGHQAGYLSDMVNDMHEGDYTNPVTAPESSLPMLAALLGVSGRYARSLSRAELREHLVSIVEGRNPAAGSRDLLALTARQWLTGTREVSVVSGSTPGAYPSPAERDLLAATGKSGVVHARGPAPTRPRPAISWEGTPGASASVWTVDGVRAWENLSPDGSFEYGGTGWTSSSATTALDTAHADHGDTSLKVTPNTATSAPVLYGTWRTPLDGSDVVHTVRVYSPVERLVGLTVHNEGTTPSHKVTRVPAGRWSTLTHTHTPTAGVRYRASLATGAGAGPWWVDSITEARTQYAPGVYFDGDTPEPATDIARDVWLDADGTPHLFNTTTWAWEAAPDHQTAGEAVLSTWDAHRYKAAHTLLIFARADEVPGNDLPAFADFLNASGVVPAGHKITTQEASQPWDAWETAVGPTWADLEARTTTWNDSDSIGVNLNTEGTP